MKRSKDVDVLCVMPAFEGSFGGVQASGSEAWRGILERMGDARARAIFYESGTSKVRAAFDAFGFGGQARVALVWHLQLLKLIPFLRRAPHRTLLFLHGVECWRRLDPITLRLILRVDTILSNSDHTWERFLALNPECRNVPHITVPLGLDAPLNEDSLASSDPPAALMIGRIVQTEDYKGHREVIDVWPTVRERCPGAELWIVGGGDLKPKLEALAKDRGVGESVRFFGEIPDAQRDDLLARCRCLALPSRGEGFGLVYLEAMRLGRPCLVSDADAGREVVAPPEAGLAVNPSDRRDVANGLVRLLTPGSEWERWSVQARARYERLYRGSHFRARLIAALFGDPVKEDEAARSACLTSNPA